MDAVADARGPDAELFERDAFRMLEHVYRVSGARAAAAVLGARAADALGLERGRAHLLIEYLVQEGHLTWDAAGPSVSITPHGILYIERTARRRRSVRRRGPAT